MWIFESAFLYVDGQYVDFVTDVGVDFISGDQAESTLKEEFAGVAVTPRYARISFTRLMPFKPSPGQKSKASALNGPTFSFANDPPKLTQIHTLFTKRAQCTLSVRLANGSDFSSKGYLTGCHVAQSVAQHLRWDYTFVGNMDTWHAGSGGDDF